MPKRADDLQPAEDVTAYPRTGEFYQWCVICGGLWPLNYLHLCDLLEARKQNNALRALVEKERK